MNLVQRLARLESKLIGNFQTKLGLNRATLTFKVPVEGELEYDFETGLEVPQLATQTIYAYLEMASSQTKSQENLELPGVNSSSLRVNGTLISPAFLPQYIRPMSVADVSIDGPYPIKGTLLLLPSLEIDNSIMGHHFSGYLNLTPGCL